MTKDKNYGVAIADISTGDFFTTEFADEQHILNEVTRYLPNEIILDFEPNPDTKIFMEGKKIYTQKKSFSYKRAYETLIQHYKTASLEGFGIEEKDACVIAAGELLRYLIDTQKTDVLNIKSLRNFSPDHFLMLDASTLRNLEVTNNIIDNSSKNTLLESIDETITAMGSRQLKQWIKRPLINKTKIQNRLDAVETLKKNSLARAEIEDVLTEIYDIERLISKISYATANPRDLIALKNSLLILPKLKELISQLESNPIFNEIAEMNTLNEICDLISESIKDDPPLSIRDANFIQDGFNSQLDELRKIKSSGKDWIISLENKIKTELGFNLKIGFNRVFGYFIEINKRFSDQVPDTYIRKQTTANAERYITQDLKEKEELILGADEKIKEIEYSLYTNILSEISNYIGKLQDISNRVAKIDIINAFASVAYVNNYCKPDMSNEYDIEIKNGRHPVIEQKQKSFIPNNTNFNDDLKTMIITGPNMAGKSTFMRQVACICLLAQTGCFVPADEAKLSILDRIFTRVGAHDNLVMGQSTFMVEMNETANILNNATEKSLIVLDEIGRGTSTFDGVSIAWSVVEYINTLIKAKTLFATHYHALNKLSKEFDGVKNFNIAVKERNDEIIFLRKIVEGGTNKSYGIQVAKLAGVPDKVISRSKEIMNLFEKQDNTKRKLEGRDQQQINLYDALR